MAWDQLDVNRPHLVYIVLGGFTTLFMLCSSVIKERLYIGEATVATLCGIIFGPHAANLIDPGTWGNTDQITLEFSRIVLVVQCFAVGVELPRAYMEKHWRSVVFLLVPVMTFGWLITSLFIWGLLGSHLNWLDSLVCAACVTATDPVLASSVVGKGKFAKRVPKHLRDLLSAESGCNDGMAFPFIYLGIYLIRYRPDANTVSYHWFCYTILYECIFGATYGVLVGYIARRAIKYAHEKDIIDRESFLVFYFVLALFCAGSGSILGIDDLLVGFSCGVGFSNDGWFLEKTEEAHVSNVIDLLINLAFFVYFGTIIPWGQYNSAIIGTSPWRLVVIALLVLFFRRIPVMLMLKPLIPDIKTWREALFAGHFGPIGVGAIFVAILARAELETETTTPLAVLPAPGFDHLNIIELIWPITTFLVLTSILVHGSSIAVFTLGKHINTLTITMSYTQANEEGNWMDRLPRIASRSKSSMSQPNYGSSSDSLEEKLPDYPAATLGLPENFLRRQKEEDTPSQMENSRSSSRRRNRRKSRMGGPISQSAIAPIPRHDKSPEFERSESSTIAAQSTDAQDHEKHLEDNANEPHEEIFEEGSDDIIEDEEGNVLDVVHSRDGETDVQRHKYTARKARQLMAQEDKGHDTPKGDDLHPDLEQKIQQAMDHVKEEMGDVAESHDDIPESKLRSAVKEKLSTWGGFKKRSKDDDGVEKKPKKPSSEPERRHGPAHAFRIGRTIIVEDEHGEVLKQYQIPAAESNQLERKTSYVDTAGTKQRLQRMGTWLGVGHAAEGEAGEDVSGSARPQALRTKSAKQLDDGDDDKAIRFTMNGDKRRMSKADFIRQIQQLDPKSRAEIVEDSNAPQLVKNEARADADEKIADERKVKRQKGSGKVAEAQPVNEDKEIGATVEVVGSNDSSPQGEDGLKLVDSNNQHIPFHHVTNDVHKHSKSNGMAETAAQRRRRLAVQPEGEDSDDDGTDRVPPRQRQGSSQQAKRVDSDDDGAERVLPKRRDSIADQSSHATKQSKASREPETAAERRRREGALGLSKEDSSSSEDESKSREPHAHATENEAQSPSAAPTSPRGITFADVPLRDKTGGPSIRWRDNGKGAKK